MLVHSLEVVLLAYQGFLFLEKDVQLIKHQDQSYETVRVRIPGIFFILLHHTLAILCTIYFDSDWEQQAPGNYDKLGVLILSEILQCAHGTP